jgi:hypothetical protein
MARDMTAHTAHRLAAPVREAPEVLAAAPAANLVRRPTAVQAHRDEAVPIALARREQLTHPMTESPTTPKVVDFDSAKKPALA